MAGRSANISVAITGVADFDKARKDVARDLDKIERDAKPIELSAELDSTEIRKAIELAGKLDGLVANFTVDTDASELVEAEKLARSLRAFQGRVNLSVEGQAELKDAKGARVTLADLLKKYPQSEAAAAGKERLASIK